MRLRLERTSRHLARPLRTAHGELRERLGVRVVLEADGVVGRGEACPLSSFGTETLERATAALEAFELAVVPRTLEEIAPLLSGLESVPSARFAVECALLEHLAVRKGLPVAELLGAPAASVATGALVDGADVQALRCAAGKAVAEGFQTLKVKVGARSLTEDLARVEALRDAAGPGIALRPDANGAWTEEEARAALRALESSQIELCEQPVPADGIAALRRLRGSVPARIAADESLLRTGAADALLGERPAVDVLVLKPAALGGVLRALELARRAAHLGVSSYVTTLLDGPLGTAAALHLAAVLPPGPAHGLATGTLFAEPDPWRVARGLLSVPRGAGWGLP